MKKLIQTRLMSLMLSAIMLMLPFNVIAETSDNTEIRGDWIYRSGTNEIVAYNGKGGDIVIPADSVIDASSERMDENGLYSNSEKASVPVTSITISSGAEVHPNFFSAQTRSLEKIIYNNEYEQNVSVPLFGRNKNLIYIKLPDGMTEIESGMFSDCTNLQTVIIPDSLRVIEDDAFSGCTSLKELELPNGLEEIGAGAFSGCSAMESFEVPESVTTIGGNIGLLNLKSLTFHSEDILEYMPDSRGIETINYDGEINWEFYDHFKDTVWIEKNFYNQFDEFAVYDDHLIKYVGTGSDPKIPDGIVYIDRNAFEDAHINSVEFPSGLESIEYRAFYHTPIYEVDFPESLKSIGEYAFAGCYNLTELVIPESVERIGESAFTSCTSLRKLTVLGPAYIEGLAFGSTALEPENIDLGHGAVYESQETGEEFLPNDALYYLVPGMTEDVMDTLPNWGTWYTTPMPTGVTPTERPDDAEPTPAATPSSTRVPTATPEPGATPTPAPDNTPVPTPTIDPGKQTITVSTAGDEIGVYLDGEAVTFPDAKPFVDENDRTQIPVRALGELIGFTVGWDGETLTASLSDEKNMIKIKIGETVFTKNGETIEIDTAAKVVNDRTYIPLRFVGEALGCNVEWAE